MAPAKKKATAGTTSTSTEPGRNLDGPQPQHEGANPQMEDINNETAPHTDLFDNNENTETHQLTEAVFKLKALEMKKKNIEAQLATKKEGTGPSKQAGRGKAQASRDGDRSGELAEGIPRNA